jgi:hypothetical protein
MNELEGLFQPVQTTSVPDFNDLFQASSVGVSFPVSALCASFAWPNPFEDKAVDNVPFGMNELEGLFQPVQTTSAPDFNDLFQASSVGVSFPVSAFVFPLMEESSSEHVYQDFTPSEHVYQDFTPSEHVYQELETLLLPKDFYLF